jgi:hypothetical protein
VWDRLLDEFLKQGQWAEDGDDNADREALTQDFLRSLVRAYTEAPGSIDGKRALGLFVLALGIAEWGISDPAGLEEKDSSGKLHDTDPAHRKWASDSSGDSGKHLMAYSLGGIGISHADGSEMVEFVERIAARPQLSDDSRRDLLLTIEPSRYRNGKVLFDQLRASSVCREGVPILGDDLFGVPFHHHKVGGGSKYCPAHFGSPDLQPEDWKVFRTWARLAMRQRDTQEWLIVRWMEKYWDKSLAQMSPGDGQEEEAFTNVRFRNSASSAANNFAAAAGTPVEQRIAKQMKQYHKVSGNRVLRRVDIMQRPIAFYRKILGKPGIPKFKF